MALAKIILERGQEFELEMAAEQADALVASFAKFSSTGEAPANRLIISPTESVAINFSKVAIIKRDY